jgi:hypothetical protein
MYSYTIKLDYTETTGPLDILVQYTNAQVYEMFVQDASVADLLAGITINVDTKLLNVKIVNNSPCCAANEQTINVSDFITN